MLSVPIDPKVHPLNVGTDFRGDAFLVTSAVFD